MSRSKSTSPIPKLDPPVFFFAPPGPWGFPTPAEARAAKEFIDAGGGTRDEKWARWLKRIAEEIAVTEAMRRRGLS